MVGLEKVGYNQVPRPSRQLGNLPRLDITEMKCFCANSAQFYHMERMCFSCSLFASDLEQLRVLLHDVHQHVVDVAPQVQVHVLLVLQRLPHLKKLLAMKKVSFRKDGGRKTRMAFSQAGPF